MKIDMHCHTKEGSLDSKIHLEEYVNLLKEKGYDGMLITDHNSYNAYRHYLKHKSEACYNDFLVLKGIEYDTIDAGHMLIIMPNHVKLPLLELRGLPVALLIELVHYFGGILGPAHPCGEKYLSITNTRRYRKNPDILKQFDFIESFNACESPQSNQMASNLATAYNLPSVGGSDAHKAECAGLAYADINATITSESDLINAIKEKATVEGNGSYYHGTTKEKIGRINDLLIYSFWVYNKSAALLRAYRRRIEVLAYKNLAELN